MTPRDRFIAALERRPISGRAPHFELVFYLTMEAIGKVHPLQRNYAQWDQMSETERQLHRVEMADTHIMAARKYEHSAIFLHVNPGGLDEERRMLDIVRDKTGDEFSTGNCVFTGLPLERYELIWKVWHDEAIYA